MQKGGDPVNRFNTTTAVPESGEDGMPLYFKDLRDGKVIVFRGYIEGLTEDVSPSWAPENYIGRSEPVYTYERAERSISFTLKLIADHVVALDAIYAKLNMLTSLCYPEYQADSNLGNKERMKPPLVKFRLGELYGKPNAEVGGFIRSLSYSFLDESPWDFKQGRRVPKYISAAITFQVIHDIVPSSTTPNFYGFSSTTSYIYGSAKQKAQITEALIPDEVKGAQETVGNIVPDFVT